MSIFEKKKLYWKLENWTHVLRGSDALSWTEAIRMGAPKVRKDWLKNDLFCFLLYLKNDF